MLDNIFVILDVEEILFIYIMIFNWGRVGIFVFFVLEMGRCILGIK